MHSDTIERIKERDIVMLIEQDVPLVHGASGRWTAKCPFHEEDTGSFTVYAEENNWYCFGCKKGSSHIDYICYKNGWDPGDKQAISDSITDLSWNEKIDYYAGCYRLHKKFSPVPMDLKSTNSVFGKIKDLSVNRISAPECCFKPDGLNHMLKSVETNYMVHICTGCYFQAILNMPKDRKVEILMLPEFIRMVQES